MSAIVDGAAQVIAEVITGKVFASGITASVLTAEPEVTPLADDFTEAGLPAVMVAMGPWKPVLQPGNERLHVTLHCAVWRPRVPLAENVNALYADRDLLADAWIAHTKAYLTEATLQSAVLMGGPGIVPRTLSKGESSRVFLTLPFTVEIVCNRIVVPQAA